MRRASQKFPGSLGSMISRVGVECRSRGRRMSITVMGNVDYVDEGFLQPRSGCAPQPRGGRAATTPGSPVTNGQATLKGLRQASGDCARGSPRRRTMGIRTPPQPRWGWEFFHAMPHEHPQSGSRTYLGVPGFGVSWGGIQINSQTRWGCDQIRKRRGVGRRGSQGRPLRGQPWAGGSDPVGVGACQACTCLGANDAMKSKS